MRVFNGSKVAKMIKTNGTKRLLIGLHSITSEMVREQKHSDHVIASDKTRVSNDKMLHEYSIH